MSKVINMSENAITKIETCLILLKGDASSQSSERVEALVKRKGGMVLLRLPEQRVLIVNIDLQAKESVKVLPEVELIGGIRMKPRQVPKLRVRLKPGSSLKVRQVEAKLSQ